MVDILALRGVCVLTRRCSLLFSHDGVVALGLRHTAAANVAAVLITMCVPSGLLQSHVLVGCAAGVPHFS